MIAYFGYVADADVAGLSAGGIAGIVIALLILLLVTVLALALMVYKRGGWQLLVAINIWLLILTMQIVSRKKFQKYLLTRAGI